MLRIGEQSRHASVILVLTGESGEGMLDGELVSQADKALLDPDDLSLDRMEIVNAANWQRSMILANTITSGHCAESKQR